ncbi:MAG TPA: hypothetical protein VGL60_08070 [Acidimicrobiales bacterium]|jgi:hypothetical protein
MRHRYPSDPQTMVRPGAGPLADPPDGRSVERQTVTEAGTRARVVERPSWSPVQLVGAVGGLVLTIIGAIALARTGTQFSDLAATHAQAAGLYFSALSALVQLVAGVLLLGASVFPESAKAASALFGVALLAWGIVVIADASRLLGVWGYSTATGVFYVVTGAVLLIVAAISPIFYSSQRRVARGEASQMGRGYRRI